VGSGREELRVGSVQPDQVSSKKRDRPLKKGRSFVSFIKTLYLLEDLLPSDDRESPLLCPEEPELRLSRGEEDPEPDFSEEEGEWFDDGEDERETEGFEVFLLVETALVPREEEDGCLYAGLLTLLEVDTGEDRTVAGAGSLTVDRVTRLSEEAEPDFSWFDDPFLR